MSKRAVYAGSFAPVHLGHIYVLEQACALFDEVHILLASNIQKKSLFSTQFRMELLKLATQDFKNIRLVYLNEFVVDYMLRENIEYAIRGVRDSNDFCYEQNMAYTNAKLNTNCKTILIPTRQELVHISSSLLRDCLYHNKSVAEFVPSSILPLLQKYPNGK